MLITKKIIAMIKIYFCRDLLVNVVASSVLATQPLRYLIYRLYGIETKTRHIQARCFFGNKNIKIGKNTSINFECSFDNSGKIEIGNFVNIGMGVMFVTSLHLPDSKVRRAGTVTGKDIVVGDGTWIGSRATILPGVTIGEGCLIAAGAIVTNDCEPNCLYAGVPARRVEKLPILSELVHTVR